MRLMGVDERFMGLKTGNAMMVFCLVEARRRGFEKLVLFSKYQTCTSQPFTQKVWFYRGAYWQNRIQKKQH